MARKLISLVLAAVVVLAMMSVTFAADDPVTITIAQDNSYVGTAGEAGRNYTWYKVFSATYTANESTGGGSTSGVPGDVAGTATAVAYIASSDVAAKLGECGFLLLKQMIPVQITTSQKTIGKEPMEMIGLILLLSLEQKTIL